MCFVPTGCCTHRTGTGIQEGLLPRITMQRQPDPALWSDMSWEVGKREGGEHSGLGQGSGGEGGLSSNL